MGGSNSKNRDFYEKSIDVKLNNTFDANCQARASSFQEIHLNNVNFFIRDNCKLEFVNRAVLNTTCEMGPIIDAIAEMAVATDEEFAKTLQDTNDRESLDKCEADNCIDRLKVNVKKHLDATCGSQARATQSFNMHGGTIYCDGNSVATYGNFAEVRASCLRDMLYKGCGVCGLPEGESSVIESQANSVNPGSGDLNNTNTDQDGELDHNTMLMIGLAFFGVAYTLVKKNQEYNH